MDKFEKIHKFLNGKKIDLRAFCKEHPEIESLLNDYNDLQYKKNKEIAESIDTINQKYKDETESILDDMLITIKLSL